MPKILIKRDKPFLCPLHKKEIGEGKIPGMITVEQCEKNECGFFMGYDGRHLVCSYYEPEKKEK